MKKRISAVLLTLCMIVGLLPAPTVVSAAAEMPTFLVMGGAKLNSDNSVQLTPIETWQSGGVWSRVPLNISAESSLEFEFYMGGGNAGSSQGNGADGISVSFAPGIPENFGQGEELGFYGAGAFGVEYDTWYNSHRNDCLYADHVAIINGSVSKHVATYEVELDDAAWHTTKITYNNGTLRMELDGAELVSYSGLQDLEESYIGIAASTGTYTNQHLIRNVRWNGTAVRLSSALYHEDALTLSIYQPGDHLEDEADDQLMPGATAYLFVGAEQVLSAEDADQDGKVTFDLSGLSYDERVKATVSAVASETYYLPETDLRYPLVKRFGTNEEGGAEKFIMELHSETIDSNGNWCGVPLAELLSADTADQKLVLREPRMLVNLSVAYKDIDGDENAKKVYREKVQETMSQFSQDLAQATDGHVMVNKVLIGTVGDVQDFFFHKVLQKDVVGNETCATLASMADIQIKSATIEKIRIHSAASVKGYLQDDLHAAYEFINLFEKIEDVIDIPEILDKNKYQLGSFATIQLSGTMGAGWNYSLLSSSVQYAQTMVHEAGHYIFGLRDEYESGYTEDIERLTWYEDGRPKGSPLQFGLMENQHVRMEMSNSADYTYLSGDFSDPLKNTEQSYFNKMSCEEWAASELTNRAKEQLGVNCAYTLRGAAYRTAKYPYAALDASDFTDFPAEQLAYPAQTEASSLQMSSLQRVSGAASQLVTSDGFLYFTPAETVYLYVVPEQETAYTFTEGTTDAVYGAYKAANQSVIIEVDESGQSVCGELYSVAGIDADIDYSSVQWFVCQDGSWRGLDTDLTTEENGNIGARCDYVGAGEYVVMAKQAAAAPLAALTDLTYTQSTTQDAVVQLEFTDSNESGAVSHYRVYVSETAFDDAEGATGGFFRADADSSGVTVDLETRGRTAYVALVAVGYDGAKSPMTAPIQVVAGEADSDGDGIPDWYCDQNQLWGTEGEALNIAAHDKDGDGFTNLQEYQAGSDPGNVYDHPDNLASVTLSGIQIAQLPDQVFYTEGAGFEPNGMVVEAVYSDGTTKPVWSYAVMAKPMLSTRDTGVAVSYTEDGVTKTAEVPISVRERVSVTDIEFDLSAPDAMKVTAAVRSNEDTVLSGVLYAAVYGEGNQMLAVACEALDLEAGENVSKSLALECDTAQAKRIKLFLLDGSDAPLCDVLEKELS